MLLSGKLNIKFCKRSYEDKKRRRINGIKKIESRVLAIQHRQSRFVVKKNQNHYCIFLTTKHIIHKYDKCIMVQPLNKVIKSYNINQ